MKKRLPWRQSLFCGGEGPVATIRFYTTNEDLSKCLFEATSSVFRQNCKQFRRNPPGPAGPFSLKTVHWTVFRALEPFPKGEGFWIRLVRLTCRGCWGRQRPDFQSYAATCAPRAGAFLRQGACDQSKKGFLADFTTRRFVPVYSASFLFRINRHKTQVKSGGGSLEGGACSPLNGRQPDKSPFLNFRFLFELRPPAGVAGARS